jgi:hypothetical protein
VADRFALKVISGKPAKLLVDNSNQLVAGFLVTLAPGAQYGGYILGLQAAGHGESRIS